MSDDKETIRILRKRVSDLEYLLDQERCMTNPWGEFRDRGMEQIADGLALYQRDRP